MVVSYTVKYLRTLKRKKHLNYIYLLKPLIFICKYGFYLRRSFARTLSIHKPYLTTSIKDNEKLCVLENDISFNFFTKAF